MQKRNHFHREQHKRYATGTYRNPYFQAPKKPFKRYVFFFLSAIFVFLFVIIYLFAYPTYRIQSVQIQGTESSLNQPLETQIRAYLNQSRLLFFHRTNRFLFSKEQFKTFLEKSFAFDQLHITQKKQTLLLSIKQRTSDVIWITNGESYLIDLEGVVTQNVNANTLARSLPVFTDRNNKPVRIGDQVLSPNHVKNILAFEHILTTNGFGFREAQIDLQAGKWMGIVTLQGYMILFDPDGDLQAEFDRLKLILRDTIKDTSNLQYIDLRFGDHVYFK